jgi:hypothetical protein
MSAAIQWLANLSVIVSPSQYPLIHTLLAYWRGLLVARHQPRFTVHCEALTGN